ncbi:CIC_collapsed_G0027230.mRNA.1.CDS.1 [Saccharomyces cerevisiae]|nr:CIC_collapsed_G0027230.mRNA.1.CDS.1 [Saccharomyces cerevisiae]
MHQREREILSWRWYIAIPYSFKSDGVLVGVILTLLAAVDTSGLGLFVLSKCSKTLINPRNSSFFTLCMLTYPILAPILIWQ